MAQNFDGMTTVTLLRPMVSNTSTQQQNLQEVGSKLPALAVNGPARNALLLLWSGSIARLAAMSGEPLQVCGHGEGGSRVVDVFCDKDFFVHDVPHSCIPAPLAPPPAVPENPKQRTAGKSA
jgi:hypothetical protein